jgi:hypothetical protein
MESSYTIIEITGGGPGLQGYKPIIMSTWLHGLRNGSAFFKDTESKAYYARYAEVIQAILNRPTSTIRLAVLADDHDVVIGWSAFDGAVLHFVYVRPGEKGASGRRQGVATALCPKRIDVFTHLTKTGRAIWKKKFPKAIFNPF